ncbi:MAG: RNA 3'-terminal phosphate cyclase [Candidatus Altiarchaeota archaeon]|nr:RNA 3'-terminal phosphate cyclase [Candidatus Altiarchaeota archaeon]
MITIDGSYGEGGGQVLRTSVAMSAVTGKSFRIEGIRAKRENPGIRPQHLHAVNAVAKLCDAKVEGLNIGSQELEFSPGGIKGGGMSLKIGTAGSITLVLQALMIPAMFAKKEVRVRITGGTDVGWSPQIDYLRFVTLPILEKFGYMAEINLTRRGYYPAGGGQVEARIQPIDRVDRIELMEQGRLTAVKGISHCHSDLEKSRVARRQARSARPLLYNALSNMGFNNDIEIKQEHSPAFSYGSGITLWAETENTRLGSSSLGERGKRAEIAGEEAAESLIWEINSKAALDRYMADQIIPYIALAGGCVSVSETTEHAKTNIEVLNRFGFDVRIEGKTIRSRGFS